MCITKYRLFTGDQWLPEEPQFHSGDGSIIAQLLDVVNIDGYFGVKGGEPAFVSEFLDVPTDLKLADSSAKHRAVSAEVNTYYFFFFVFSLICIVTCDVAATVWEGQSDDH